MQPLKKKPAVNHPPVMKSNTVPRFKIISGLWNNAIYRITGGFLYSATSNLKRVTERIFTISKCFHRSRPKLFFTLDNKAAKKFKTIGACTGKYRFDF
jgi:hypothetical protein